MNDTHGVFKMVFGLVIFLFATALAFFAADYFETDQTGFSSLVLFIFGATYIAAGIGVSHIIAVSLPFLFSADVVILYLLADDFFYYGDLSKLLIVGLTLSALYAFAVNKLADKPAAQPASETQTESV